MDQPENNIENGTFEYVYGIHEGSVFEGGGMGNEVYKDFQLALELAGQIVSENQREQNEAYSYEEQDNPNSLPHQWKFDGNGRWTNGSQEVCVIELRVI